MSSHPVPKRSRLLVDSMCIALMLAAACTQAAERHPSSREYGQWRSSRFGGGGYILGVVHTSDPKRYYAHIDVGGAYRSDDGGWTWHALHAALPVIRGTYNCRDLLVDPRDPDVLLIAVGTKWGDRLGLFRSADGGKRFQSVLSEVDFDGNDRTRWSGSVLARSPANPDVILAGSLGDGIFRSDDNGLTWTRTAALKSLITDIVFDASDPDRVWACGIAGERRGAKFTEAGLFESRDAGRTWSQRSAKAPMELVQHPKQPERLVGVFDAKRVLASSDGGVSWSEIHDGLIINPKADDNGRSGYRAITHDDRSVLLANGQGEFFRLEAGSKQWTRQAPEHIDARDWWGNTGQRKGFVHFGAATAGLTVDPRDPNHWFMTDWYAIWQTFDAGKSWTLSVEGIEATVIHQLLQDPSNPDIIHAGMADNGYLRSADSGSSFETRRDVGITNNVKDIAVSPRDPSRLYAVSCATHGWRSNQVFISSDAGVSWKRSAMTGLPDMSDKQFNCNTIAVDPGEPGRVFLAVSGPVREGAGGPYVSSDGGMTWKWIGHGLESDDGWYSSSIWKTGRELAIGPDGTLVTVSPRRNGVAVLKPGATRWVPSETSLQGKEFAVAADANRSGQFFVSTQGGESGVYRTRDHGATWERVYAPEGGATHVTVDAAPAHAGRVAVATATGPAWSPDGGKTWDVLDDQLPHRSIGNMPAFAGDRLLVGSDGGGLYWILLKP